MTVSTKHYVAVNLGSGPNTGTGDDLLTAFNKINQNFGNYESVGFPTGDISASGTVQAAYFVGDASQLTNLPLGGMYSNANVASYLTTYNGNIANVRATPITGGVYADNYYFSNGTAIIGYSNVQLTSFLIGNTTVTIGNLIVLGNTTTQNTEILIRNEVVYGNITANGNIQAYGFNSNIANIANIILSNNSVYSGLLGTDIQFGQLAATANIVMNRNVVHNRDLFVIGNILANSVSSTGNVIGGLAQFASINSTPIGNATASTGAFTTLTTSGATSFNSNVTAGGYLFSNAIGGSGSLTNQTGIAPAYQYYAMNGNLLLPNGTGDVRIFNANVFLSASTAYEFEVSFAVFRNITPTVTSTQLQFNLGSGVATGILAGIATTNWVNYTFFSGNASPGNYGGEVVGANFTGNTIAGWGNVLANITFTNASTAGAADIWTLIKGTIVTSTAGWVSPRVAYTAAPGGVSYVQGGSYMKIAAIGIGSSGSANVSVGTWAA